MARHWGMAIAPWDAIGGGKFQTKKQLEERKKNNEGLRSIFGGEQSENEAKISEALEKVANEHGIESPTAVALAYVMAKTPNVFPIVGGRKVSAITFAKCRKSIANPPLPCNQVEHLHQNIKSLEIKLSKENIEYLESILPFEPGFPNNFVGEDPHLTGQASGLLGAVAPMSFVQARKPIGHE